WNAIQSTSLQGLSKERGVDILTCILFCKYFPSWRKAKAALPSLQPLGYNSVKGYITFLRQVWLL
ncbi:MAG: hypothetical protein LBE79_06925, partial [Tannerella sp.]|nr:hypothetical protein [Tannerella sp.]